MKLNELREALRSRADIADWRIAETAKTGSECFLIGERLDLARSAQTRDYQATVFVDAESDGSKLRGAASASIHPTMSAAEIRAVLDRAVFAASKSRNPWYPLAGPRPASVSVPRSGFEGRAPESWTDEILKALSAGARRAGEAGGRVNSLELFLGKAERRVLSSQGVDASWSGWSGTVELTVEADGPSGGVELTDWIHFSEPDFGRLGDKMGRRIASVADRAAARPTPALAGLPLVLAGKEAEAILRSPRALGRALPARRARLGALRRGGLPPRAVALRRRRRREGPPRPVALCALPRPSAGRLLFAHVGRPRLGRGRGHARRAGPRGRLLLRFQR
jgi:predicted Zn-dependent protease